MKPVEEIIGDKILELLHLCLSIIVKPDITIDKVTELDENQIKEIKQKYGIEGIILDVDETLRKDMKAIPEVNQQWIENLRSQLKIIIVSNGIDKKMEAYFKECGCEYVLVDVFAYNTNGYGFYSNRDYHSRMRTMIKDIR